MSEYDETAEWLYRRGCVTPAGIRFVARAIEEAVAAERRWWINQHIEIAAMPAPDIKAAIVCPSGSEVTPQDACQIGWAGACMALGTAIRARKP